MPVLPALLLAAAPAAHFTNPQQPWASPDGRIRLLRPAVARPSFSQQPLGSLMSPGWRLVWNGKADGPGHMGLRLALPVVRKDGPGRMTEVLQIGWSAAPAAVRTCLSFGFAGGPNGAKRPPRLINGVRFAVWANGDGGMSQSIDAADLRAVVGGRCYAVERFRYGVSAVDADPAVTLTQADGAAMLDRALASLRLGPGPGLTPPHPTMPRGTRAY
jgi:hypothetical protein